MTFGAGKIWMDGEFVEWADAKIHVMSHVAHYGSSVFEGIRCYETKQGPAIFRLDDHVRRLFDSGKIYRMELPFTPAEIKQAIIDTVRVNNLKSCYIRPLVYRGLGTMGVNPLKCPVNCTIAAWSWGTYLGEDAMTNGVSVRVSSWSRPAPNTLPTLAKAGGNYLNSQLVRIEATEEGYDEGIALDHYGFVSEGSGENIFMVRNGVIYTPPSSSSILPGITRHCVFMLARDFGVRIHQQVIPREALYIADEVFFSGTAAEITPVSKIDNISIGDGKRGPVTERIQSEFFKIVSGEIPDRFNWFTPVV
ncbi:MAG: branched-chain amino acid transaminase [Verrucomicrobia bacterium]|nr:branched-chain amino acid transaminase [Verrucomicrobiota bacterium]